MYELTALFWYKSAFMAELLIAEWLFTFHLKRRSHYVLRLAAVSAGCLGLSFALPVFAYNVFGVSLLFVTMFALTVVAGIAWIVIRCVRHPEYK